MELKKYEPRSLLDFDISSNRDMQLRSEGTPSDIIATGLATAVVLAAAGISWALSNGDKKLGDR